MEVKYKSSGISFYASAYDYALRLYMDEFHKKYKADEGYTLVLRKEGTRKKRYIELGHGEETFNAFLKAFEELFKEGDVEISIYKEN